MGTIRVRCLDDQVVERLKRRAAANNRSLESEARHILEQAAKDDMAEKVKSFLALSARLRKETGSVSQTPSYLLIAEDRESGHRDG